MLLTAADYPAVINVPEDEDHDDFEIIIDEPLLCVVRCNGKVAAQVHSPVDLVDLSYRLAEVGFMATEMLGYEDGVLELLLHDLASDAGDLPPSEAKAIREVANYMKEREGAYA